MSKVPKHGRIKPKYRKNPNAEEKRYWEHERAKGCLVCGQLASIHHVTTEGKGRISRDHKRITPLCWMHHQGPEGIHMLGHDEFTERYGINLYDKATENYDEWKTL